MSESMNPDPPFSLPSQLDRLTIGTSRGGKSDNECKKVPSTYRDVVNHANSISIGVQNTYYAGPSESITPVGKSIASMIEEIQLIIY
jgi:hypothetical protein